MTPSLESPAEGAAVQSTRPTFVVRNGTSDHSDPKFYEFQVSDRSDFSTSSSTAFTTFAIIARKGGVPEGTAGTTSYTPDVDLQPTTRLYWRARTTQTGSASEWSSTRSFTTPIMGFNRAGELYDPLLSGATVGAPVGSTTFVVGKGIRLNDGNSYVRYQLQQPLDSGEFSMEIEGLSPSGPGGKLKVFSMMDGTYDLFRSPFLLNAQYRGTNGNPDNAISFKALFGDLALKLEPDIGVRIDSIRMLDPNRAYLWKGTWSSGFRLVIQEGIGGPTIYDYGLTLADIGAPVITNYNPNPHFAYLGANNGPFKEEEASWPGAIYRNVWIGRGARPASLGSALVP